MNEKQKLMAIYELEQSCILDQCFMCIHWVSWITRNSTHG